MNKTLKNHFNLLASCLFAAAIASPTLAFADCDALDQNTTWNQGLMQIQKQVESAKYAEALETAQPLFAICQESPVLLYYTGLAMRGTGDEERAKIYFQKSSESLSKMAAEPELSQKIWYTRYEAEHTESTPDAIKEKERTIESLSKQVADLNKEKQHLEQSSVELSASSGNEVIHYHQVMWTGIGIGIGGLAITTVGAVLVGLSKDSDEAMEVKTGTLSENGIRIAGWTLLGTGIGLTAAGIVTAGIGGYHYSKAKEDAVMSLQVAPMGASFRMTF